MIRLPVLSLAVLFGLIALAPVHASPLQGQAATFSADQAARGKEIFDRQCAECHHMTLKGSGHGPELAGPNFMAKWQNQAVSDLITFTSRTMPPSTPGSLPEASYADLVAYMLKVNGAAAGDTALQADTSLVVGAAVLGASWDPEKSGTTPEEAKAAFESWSGADTIAQAAKEASGFVNKVVAGYQPVSDEMLQNPSAEDWLNWRRTQDGQGYSPLDQINRDNVHDLKLAWAMTMHEGSNQTTPPAMSGPLVCV